MDENKPKYLYRGIKINYKQLKNFKFTGVDLKVPYAPIIDKNGRKTVEDGNEYGVYMTDNENMTKYAYGNVRSADGTSINRDIKLGNPPETIKVPDIAICYKINTEGINIRKPWITDSLKELYNNGFEGDEWIADKIPAQNYSIYRIKIGKDFIHDSEEINLESIEDYSKDVNRIIEERLQRLNAFIKDMSKFSDEERRKFNINDFMLFKAIYGENGIKYINEEDLDISKSKQAIQYAMMKVSKENTDKIDMKSLTYLDLLQKRIEKSKKIESDSTEYLKRIILDDIENENQKKEKLIERKLKAGEEPKTINFDKKISMMKLIIEKIEEKEIKNEQKLSPENYHSKISYFNDQKSDLYFTEQKIGKATVNTPSNEKEKVYDKVEKDLVKYHEKIAQNRFEGNRNDSDDDSR